MNPNLDSMPHRLETPDPIPHAPEPFGALPQAEGGSLLDPALERAIRAEQNLAAGLLAGGLAALASAILWAGIAVIVQRQFGLIAMAVGAFVGWAVRHSGRGIAPIFGIAGGTLSGLGIVAGNLLTIAAFAARDYAVPFGDVLLYLARNPDKALVALTETFTPIDLLFYGFAVYYGFKESLKATLDELPMSQTSIDQL